MRDGELARSGGHRTVGERSGTADADARRRSHRSQQALPEEYTQLYYTPVYQSLHRQHRLRYNQLFGVRINEYIMMLEVDLVERLLSPLRRHPKVAGNPTLVRCLSTMIEEENDHYRCFVALNRACFPDLYRTRERYFSDLPWPTRALLATIGLLAGRFAFALWYLMAWRSPPPRSPAT
jgi:hypothetical protein